MTMSNFFSGLPSEFNKTLFNTSASKYFEPLVEKYFPEKSLVNIKAKVLETKQESVDVLTIVLKPSKKWNSFLPGQYLEIGVKINGVLYFRNFSISSTLEQFQKEGTISLSIQKQDKGKVTQWIFDELKTGNLITISQAKGCFAPQNSTEPVLFIAGGTGITPFISLLHTAVLENRNAVLLYYAKAGKHILREKLEAMTSASNITVQFITTSEEGRISEAHLQQYCPDFCQRSVLVCGPNHMIEDTKSLLSKLGYEEEKVVFEYFKAASFSIELPDISTKATLKVANKTLEVKGTTSILEQLENNGFTPKYGCRMGLCKQCQCIKNSGTVFNKLTGKYSESTEEVIQICVSVPVGVVSIQL
jgi:ferredoxin-NADP reductase